MRVFLQNFPFLSKVVMTILNVVLKNFRYESNGKLNASRKREPGKNHKVNSSSKGKVVGRIKICMSIVIHCH